MANTTMGVSVFVKYIDAGGARKTLVIADKNYQKRKSTKKMKGLPC